MSLNVLQILEFAKAGYKPSDVKELIELSKAEPEPQPEPEPKPEPQPDPQPDPQPEPKTDYKALYEATQKKLADTENALKSAQSAVQQLDLSKGTPEVDDWEKVKNLLR